MIFNKEMNTNNLTLGFYYHIPYYSKDNNLKTPFYLGIFIDELAKYFKKLILIGYEYKDKKEADYTIKSKNIEFRSLGDYRPNIIRKLRLVANLRDYTKDADILFLNIPTPLFLPFSRTFNKKKVYMLLGDLTESSLNYSGSKIKKLIILVHSLFTELTQIIFTSRSLVFCNGGKLFKRYSRFNKQCYNFFLTNLKNSKIKLINHRINKRARILYSGRISSEKGLDILIQAIEIISNDNDVELNIVGNYNKNNWFYKKLIKNLEKLKCKNKIHFLGHQSSDKLKLFYKESDILVIPSRTEAFPRVISEAMDSGLPIIASNVGGIPYYIKNERNGMLFKSKDSKDLSQKIEKLINNKKIYAKIRNLAFKSIKGNTIKNQTKFIVSKINKDIKI